MTELAFCERFGEDVGNLFRSWTIPKINDLYMNQLPNEMYRNLNVLGLLPVTGSRDIRMLL